MSKKKFARYSLQDKALLLTGYILLGLFVVAIIIPMIYIIVGSFMDPITLQNKGLTFDFSKWTLTAYQRVFSNAQIWIGFKNAVIYSVVFTVISVFVTLLAAYPMSRTDFKGRGLINVIFVITMFFGGGLIPTYLLINNLGMKNTMWAIVIPGAFSVWNMIIIRSFFADLPPGLVEAAKIDGAGEYRIFFQIILPLSKPVLATIILFSVVGHWNSYFDSMMYTSSENLQTIQFFLKKLITDPGASGSLASSVAAAIPDSARKVTPQTIKLAAMVITSLPIVCIYPMLQKYFAKGVMVGSVKG